MKSILLSNLGLVNLHGSEIWTWTVAEHLNGMGFDTTILTNKIGKFADDYLGEFEVITNASGRYFDYGIINHSRLLAGIKGVKIGMAALVSHGCIADNERPTEVFSNPHTYVSVSEEVRRHWFNAIGIESTVIVNPVRDDWFKIPLANGRLKTVAYTSHRHPMPAEMVNVFMSAGIQVRRTRRGHSQSEMMRIIASSQIVIGTGRYIYEAMAAGKGVIVADAKLSLGYVTKSNYENRMWYNMTCRNPEASVPDWNRLLLDYPNHDPNDMREIAKREHHVSVITDKYLELLGV